MGRIRDAVDAWFDGQGIRDSDKAKMLEDGEFCEWLMREIADQEVK